MIVPDMTGLSNATEALNNTDAASTTNVPADAVAVAQEVVRKAKTFGKAAAGLQAPNGTRRTTQAEKQPAGVLKDRQSCASGSAFYACANGFVGCCSVNPCDPGTAGGCPDEEQTSSSSVKAAAATTVKKAADSTEDSSSASAITTESTHSTTSHTSTSKHSTTDKSSTSTKAGSTSHKSTTSTKKTGLAVASPTSSRPASSTTRATPAPDCPTANNTVYTDTTKIEYKIHCNADNSYSSSKTVAVGMGGYGECFSACSVSTDCAGFTYVGLDSGDCYLKHELPNDEFVQKDGSNFISAVKVNATAASPLPSASSTRNPSAAKQNSVAAIAGGVVGGIAFLALILLLIAWLAKRRRHKIEERRATVTHVYQGPLEAQEMLPTHNQDTSPSTYSGGHARSGSTAHDAFAPFGGFYRGLNSKQADTLATDERDRARAKGAFVPDRPPPSLPPGMRAEGEGFMLPATVYKRPGDPSADAVAMLDSTPIKRPSPTSPGSRSPRFREHIAEMEDTSFRPPRNAAAAARREPGTPDTDSPTLGRSSESTYRSADPALSDAVTRKQHLLSWNTYEGQVAEHGRPESHEMTATMGSKAPPAARSPGQVSPDLSSTPRDRDFVVSPFGSVDRGKPVQRYGSL